jgi:hypothetical protein
MLKQSGITNLDIADDSLGVFGFLDNLSACQLGYKCTSETHEFLQLFLFSRNDLLQSLAERLASKPSASGPK